MHALNIWRGIFLPIVILFDTNLIIASCGTYLYSIYAKFETR